MEYQYFYTSLSFPPGYNYEDEEYRNQIANLPPDVQKWYTNDQKNKFYSESEEENPRNEESDEEPSCKITETPFQT